MVKLSVLIKRKQGMSREEFLRYWEYVHGPLALITPDFMRHITKYVQCHQVEPAPGEPAPQYDGIVELWADSIKEMNQAFASPGYKNVIQPDERNFCDDTNVIVMTTVEKPMKG